MKIIKIFFLLFCLSCLLQINAQYLGNSSYQIVLRDEKNQLLTNDSVDLKITILYANIIKYEELHSIKTNTNGLASLILGKGMVIYGELKNINLGNGNFFVKSEYKRKTETTYKIIETNQLMSVPSAIYANNGIPTGATNGQILTFCEGKPQWRDYGQCPNIAKPGNGISDKFGNVYKTMLVGEDEWMAENLIVSKYTKDHEFPEHINAFIIDTLDEYSARTMVIKYNLKNVCPIGWSIPSKDDWENLSNHFGRFMNNQESGFIPKGLLYKYIKIDGNEDVIDTIINNSEIFEPKKSGFWWASNKEIEVKDWIYTEYGDIVYYYSTYNSMAYYKGNWGDLNTTDYYCWIYDFDDYSEYYGKFNDYQKEIVAPRANVRCIKNK